MALKTLMIRAKLDSAQRELDALQEQDEIFAAREAELAILDAIDTADVERMVHVMPILTVVREDVVVKSFTREALQEGAPETDEGYWCVPRVVE